MVTDAAAAATTRTGKTNFLCISLRRLIRSHMQVEWKGKGEEKCKESANTLSGLSPIITAA